MAVSSATLRAGAEYVGIEPAKADILSIDRQFVGIFIFSFIFIDNLQVSTLFDCLVASDDFYSCKFLEKLNGGRFNQSKRKFSFKKNYHISILSCLFLKNNYEYFCQNFNSKIKKGN